jgi:hypothetical protein
MRQGLKSTRLVLPTFPPNTAGGRRTLLLWATAIEATNNRHILETGSITREAVTHCAACTMV